MRHFIKKYSKLNKKKVICCEVGIELCEHANQILDNLDIKQLHLVDNFTEHPDFKQRAIDSVKGKPVIFHIGQSIDMAKEVKNETLDFVYIDALHDYDSVMEDLRAWYPKVKNGGYVAGHDWAIQGVKNAVIDFTNDINKIDLCYENDELGKNEDWYFRK